MKKILLTLVIFSLIVGASISGCRYKPGVGFSWDTDIAAPIAYSEAGIFDVVKDTNGYTQIGADNLISVVFRDTVVDLKPQDYFTIPDTSVKQALSLGTLELTSDTISQKITLGFLARRLINSGNVQQQDYGQFILDSHGNDILFPPISGVTSDPIDVDASQFFTYAEILSGDISLTIENKLPIHLKDVSFEVKNKNLGTKLISDTFPSIPRNTKVTELYDMAGKTVESAMLGQMTNLSSDATIAKCDTNSYIRIALVAVKLKAKNAIATFPDQRVVDTVRKVVYRFGSSDVEISKIILRKGKIKVDAFSTVKDTIQFDYTLLSATDKFNVHPNINDKLPPAPQGGSSQKTIIKTLEGVTIDLTQNGTTVNSYNERIIIDLLSSGQVTTFSQQDSVFLFFGLLELEPSYVEGYIGKDTVVFKDEKALDVFKNLNIGSLDFSDPKVSLTLSNSVGADARVDIKGIEFQNTKTGQKVPLNCPYVGTPQYLNGPRVPNVGQTFTQTFTLDKNNSNIRDVISNMPNKVNYNSRVVANYSGLKGLRNNFATDSSRVTAIMDFEVPMSMMLNQFVISDTVNIDFSASIKPSDFDRVGKANLKLILNNDFPFEAKVDAVIFDQNGNEIAVLANQFVIAAGAVGANGYTSPSRTVYQKSFENADIQNILQNGRKLGLRYRLDSKPSQQHVKIFSTYKIKAKLTGEFELRVGA